MAMFVSYYRLYGSVANVYESVLTKVSAGPEGHSPFPFRTHPHLTLDLVRARPRERRDSRSTRSLLQHTSGATAALERLCNGSV
jgi:hypothetical protein